MPTMHAMVLDRPHMLLAMRERPVRAVPGHEIVGRVAALGAGVSGFTVGERVGVP